jgi:nucleoid-associated protein YgaU
LSDGHPLKATITNLVTNQEIAFLFNPTEYAFAKQVNWAAKKEKGANVPKLEFEGGQPATLTLQLFFDTSETGTDVREHTNPLWELAMVNKQKVDPRTRKGRPPECSFQWGRVWTFKAVVTNITQKFTMFLEDGTPTRATVDLQLKQAQDSARFPAQNPTSGGVAGYRTHTVMQGETLDFIAAEEYGEARHWRYIATVNDIEDPRRLRPGMALRLPPLPAK